MKSTIPDFLKHASNVYRTPHFIVRQRIGILFGKEDHNVLFSRDTYYRRTPTRDAEYEAVFFEREEIDGRRLPTSGYVRVYKD